jgi:formylglycine-generating enzyme required for sulfatase activity
MKFGVHMKISQLILMILLSISSVYSQPPEVKFYFNDGSSRTFNIEEINNMSFTKGQNPSYMKIYSQNSKSDSINSAIIDIIKFESTDNVISNLVVYLIGNTKQNFVLSKIDSIIFTTVPAPVIQSITPSIANIGDIITVKGSGFGAKQGTSYVSFSEIKAINYSAWSDTEIKVKVPFGANTGKLSVTVNNAKSNGVDFEVLVPPFISEINPSSFKPGAEVTIEGLGFGATRGSSVVNFGSLTVSEYKSWTATQIKVVAPEGAVSGLLYVTVNDVMSNEVDYKIIQDPKITSINPVSFPIGSEITINGVGFDDMQGQSIVMFGTTKALIYSYWSETKIVVKVPKGTKTGQLTVTVNNIKSNKVNYTIVSALEMVTIPAGSFDMGNTGSYGGIIYIPEEPVHEVSFASDFLMSKYEVNQKLYTAVIGTNQSNHRGPEYPVERLSWYDAVAFCNALSDYEGFTKCYTINGTNVTCDWSANGYRLPTEAEWEYACKAGTTSDFYSGRSESDLDRVAWHSGNSGDSTHVPGQLEPNDFGLYDMHGNVFEWVWDWSGNYSSSPATNPTGPMSGTVKILRGGSWHHGLTNGTCRSSMRGWEDTPNSHSSTDGIRVVRVE